MKYLVRGELESGKEGTVALGPPPGEEKSEDTELKKRDVGGEEVEEGRKAESGMEVERKGREGERRTDSGVEGEGEGVRRDEGESGVRL